MKSYLLALAILASLGIAFGATSFVAPAALADDVHE